MNAPSEITVTRSQQIAAWAAGALTREFPADVLGAAKLALIDVMGCAIGAWDDECVRPVRVARARNATNTNPIEEKQTCPE